MKAGFGDYFPQIFIARGPTRIACDRAEGMKFPRAQMDTSDTPSRTI
jgi:hypothetical protein